MPTTLLTSDWHLTERPIDSYRSRCIGETLPKLIRQHRVDRLVVLGDLTEAKDKHSSTLVNCVVDLLVALSGLCPVTVVMGNHDYYLDPGNPFFRFIANMPNISWIGETCDTDGMTLIPHLRSNDELRLIAETETGGIWLTHATFSGAVDRAHELRGLDIGLIPKGVKVYSGDIHSPQTVGPVTYVGAPYHIYFGDTFIPRVILLEDGGERSIPMPGPRKLALDVGPDWSGWEAQRGDIVSIRVRLEAAQVADWGRLRRQWLDFAARDGLVVASIIGIPPSNRALGEPRRIRRKPDDALLREYGARRRLDADTIKAGLNLLAEES